MIGNLVSLEGTYTKGGLTGIVLSQWAGCEGWWSIITKEGIVHWSGTQLTKINEC